MENTSHKPPREIIFGQSDAMVQLKDVVLRVAATNVPVLLLGESGTGKGVLAEFVHAHSPCHAGPFVSINCPAIPGTLIESELFGYEQGAFTDARQARAGRIESAQDGTLFLDEIAELSTHLQAKLLHLLQDGSFTRIGGLEQRHADVRVICATSRQLEDAVLSGAFREDLYYRINVLKIEMPPLRERRADIPVLATHFIERYQKEYRTRVKAVSSNLMQVLTHYTWPGNIRELENVMKRYVILGSEEAIVEDLLGQRDRAADNGGTSLKSLTKAAIREFEKKLILQVLYANNWNRKKTARILKISYRALFYKIKDAGVIQKRTSPASTPERLEVPAQRQNKEAANAGRP